MQRTQWGHSHLSLSPCEPCLPQTSGFFRNLNDQRPFHLCATLDWRLHLLQSHSLHGHLRHETCLLVLMIRQGHSLLRSLQVCTEQGRASVENLAPPKGPRITAWQNVCGLVILTESKGLEEQENVRTMCAMKTKDRSPSKRTHVLPLTRLIFS